MKPKPPKSEKTEWDSEHFMSAEASKNEIDRLANWIMQNCPEEIGDETAVDVAIRLMGEKVEEGSVTNRLFNELKDLERKVGFQSQQHHLHGDVGCAFFWRRVLELEDVIANWDSEMPK